MISQTENMALIEKVVSSHALHSSESLCKLLRYLAEHALNQPGIPLKEHQIATELLGRRSDFDPQVDTVVRVQAGRLRAKLAEYYATEGVGDPMRVELPKGTYVLSFHSASSPSFQNHQGIHGEMRHEMPAASMASESPKSGATRKWFFAAIAIVLAALVATSISPLRLATRKNSAPDLAIDARTAPPALQIFWKSFLTGPEEPWVVFSNASFVGRPETGMRYYDSGRDSRETVWDHYTGVGEVLAVHNLDDVFASLNRQLRVKRGSLFSLDDVKNNNLIFIGSPSENLTLQEIPNTKQFTFQRMTGGPRKGDLAIVNVHPEAGEAAAYLASPSTAPLTEDYAVVGMLRGLNPDRPVMIIAGTTTFGTQGAAEFVCRQESVKELLRRLSASKTDELKPFEALLRVKLTHGVPVMTELVAVRKTAQ